jgi:hypothetical protein
LALGVPSEELEAFEKDNEEAELKKRGMLRTWYSRESGACWDKLVEALVGLGESSLALEIARANGLSSDSAKTVKNRIIFLSWQAIYRVLQKLAGRGRGVDLVAWIHVWRDVGRVGGH